MNSMLCRPKSLVQDSALWRIDYDLSDTIDSKDELLGSIQSSGENTRGSNPTAGASLGSFSGRLRKYPIDSFDSLVSVFASRISDSTIFASTVRRP